MLFTTFTDQGSREYNEDSLAMETYDGSACFVIADGLGGHGGGDVASKTAVSVVCKLFRSEGYSDSFFEKAFKAAQEAILAEQEKANNHNGMKTTLVIMVVSGSYAYYAHVGDSRLYVLRNGKIAERTYDHSVPQMLVRSKQIKESEIRHHPDRSKLLRVLGDKDETPKCDVS
ncbi:MAG: serine/threonine-protein phosphatase, partial [Lachnospiraceae bacterium]|nr:serine/threonine-protein phosphatase [Lachnospiraceae bacterium]